MESIINSLPPGIFDWVIMPILIVLARVSDVSVGTIRIIMIGKGYRKVAPFLGFIEIFIWILAISQIMQNLNNFVYYIAYATGYALGTYIGMGLESKLSLGNVVVRIIMDKHADDLIQVLKDNNHNFTVVDAEGKFGDVKIILMISQRHLLPETIGLIEEYTPHAFYSIEDIRDVKQEKLPGGPNPIFKHLSFNHKKK
ncbi:MAG: DUF2179 domain-containing protein [Bacteroidetes bacterium]|nr:DUF2179 domain-containing protein [Bacteroidota bacterium]